MDFKSNPACRDAICNIQAGGTGVNGLQVASTVLFVELDWTPGAHAQATARVDRQGQKEPVFCHYLIAQNTIEEKICEIIQKKQRNLDAVLDGGPSDNALDIYDQLVQSLLNEGE
jgi:SWI/SNF-related matrix-associated actin-dependent regulator 1 of chromatin subfamily A